jgi:squalene synthase HpnC
MRLALGSCTASGVRMITRMSLGAGHDVTRDVRAAVGIDADLLSRARTHVRSITSGARENFTVLSRLVPAELRDHYAAVYAFCRKADDAGDADSNDVTSRERSLARLHVMRSRLRDCEHRAMGRSQGTSDSNELLFVALQDTITARKLPIKPFDDLLDAFEQDQHVTTYDTWNQLLHYCERSANPVGRLVLALHGEGLDDSPRSREMLRCSDCICTALQLTNFWQDVRRDLDERGRVYVPHEFGGMTAERLRDWISKPRDPGARRRMTDEFRELSRRTWDLYRQGSALEQMVPVRLAWILWLFRRGGEATLRLVDQGGYVTLWDRPTLSKPARIRLLLRAYWGAFRGVRPSPTDE